MNCRDEKYGAPGHYYCTEPNDFLRERCAAIPAGGTVLCLAEGEGRNAVFLAQQGFLVVADRADYRVPGILIAFFAWRIGSPQAEVPRLREGAERRPSGRTRRLLQAPVRGTA